MIRRRTEKCSVHVVSRNITIEGRICRVPGGWGFFYFNTAGKHHAAKVEDANIVEHSTAGAPWLVVSELTAWDGPAY